MRDFLCGMASHRVLARIDKKSFVVMAADAGAAVELVADSARHGGAVVRWCQGTASCAAMDDKCICFCVLVAPLSELVSPVPTWTRSQTWSCLTRCLSRMQLRSLDQPEVANASVSACLVTVGLQLCIHDQGHRVSRALRSSAGRGCSKCIRFCVRLWFCSSAVPL